LNIAGMNITYKHYPFLSFLESMKRLEFEHFELWAGEPHLFVYRNALGNIRNMKKEIKSRDLKIVCYTPEQCVYPYNLAASDPHWRKTSIDYFIDNLYAALELETDKMLITSGIGDFSVPQEESWKYASDSIYQLTKVAEKEGMALVLEPLTRFESNLITNFKELKKMIEQIPSPSLKGMIDSVAMQLAEETPDDYFLLLPELSHFHLIDGDNQSDAHLSLDDGIQDWRGYLNTLRDRGYEGTCTLEIMGSAYYQNPERAIKESLEKLKEFKI
jgi:fructoselysine 3-epimerase